MDRASQLINLALKVWSWFECCALPVKAAFAAKQDKSTQKPELHICGTNWAIAQTMSIANTAIKWNQWCNKTLTANRAGKENNSRWWLRQMLTTVTTNPQNGSQWLHHPPPQSRVKVSQGRKPKSFESRNIEAYKMQTTQQGKNWKAWNLHGNTMTSCKRLKASLTSTKVMERAMCKRKKYKQ